MRDVGVVRGTERVLPGKVWGVLRRLRGGTGSPDHFSAPRGGAGTYLAFGIGIPHYHWQLHISVGIQETGTPSAPVRPSS